DQNFPAHPSEADLTSIVGLAATRPATLSSTPDLGVNSLYLATTDSSNQVVLLTNDGGGFGMAEIVEIGPAGRSWGNPVVAVGVDAVLVYWTTGERQDDATITHRWGVKSMQAQSWMYQEAPDSTEVKRIGAGYASTDVFVLSTLTDSYSLPVIMTVSAA